VNPAVRAQARGPLLTRAGLRDAIGTFRYSYRAGRLVWTTSAVIAIWLGALSVIAGIVPAAIAYVGKLIVDAVVAGARDGTGYDRAIHFVVLELGLVVVLAAAQRGLSVCESLLRALLGQRVNELILEKALTLSLADFEDSEFYDRMTRARREASSRPLSLVRRAFGLLQNGISLVMYGGLLLHLAPWTVIAVGLAALPVFLAEAHFGRRTQMSLAGFAIHRPRQSSGRSGRVSEHVRLLRRLAEETPNRLAGKVWGASCWCLALHVGPLTELAQQAVQAAFAGEKGLELHGGVAARTA
jgi:ABC-type multidrug transport system fused ATPase/permease subunit